jgi:hypothetical protein
MHILGCRVHSAVVMFSFRCLEEHTESIKEYLLNLASCGISKFALVFIATSGDEETFGSFDARNCQGGCRGSWEYRQEMGAVLHTMITCCLYGDGEARGGALQEAALSVLTSTEHPFTPSAEHTDSAAALSLLYCQVCGRDSDSDSDSDPSSTSSTLDSSPPPPPPLQDGSAGTPFGHLFAHTFDEQHRPGGGGAFHSSTDGKLISKSKVLIIKSDLSNVNESMGNLVN